LRLDLKLGSFLWDKKVYGRIEIELKLWFLKGIKPQIKSHPIRKCSYYSRIMFLFKWSGGIWVNFLHTSIGPSPWTMRSAWCIRDFCMVYSQIFEFKIMRRGGTLLLSMPTQLVRYSNDFQSVDTKNNPCRAWGHHCKYVIYRKMQRLT